MAGLFLLSKCFLLVALAVAASSEAVSEAEQIALESSNELLAPPELVQRVEKDLAAIRAKYPAVKDVKHQAKWAPGEVIVSKTTKEKIDAITGGTLGTPVEAKSIFLNKIFLVKFNKPYNPEKIAEVLKRDFSLESVEPNGNIGGSSSITLTPGTPENMYKFYSGTGDCPSGCTERKYWDFTVGPDADSAKLVKES